MAMACFNSFIYNLWFFTYLPLAIIGIIVGLNFLLSDFIAEEAEGKHLVIATTPEHIYTIESLPDDFKSFLWYLFIAGLFTGFAYVLADLDPWVWFNWSYIGYEQPVLAPSSFLYKPSNRSWWTQKPCSDYVKVWTEFE